MLDDGLLEDPPVALCSTGTADENGDAATARWPPVECPRDFVTWQHKEGPEKPGINGVATYKWHYNPICKGYFTTGRGPT